MTMVAALQAGECKVGISRVGKLVCSGVEIPHQYSAHVTAAVVLRVCLWILFPSLRMGGLLPEDVVIASRSAHIHRSRCGVFLNRVSQVRQLWNSGSILVALFHSLGAVVMCASRVQGIYPVNDAEVMGYLVGAWSGD